MSARTTTPPLKEIVQNAAGPDFGYSSARGVFSLDYADQLLKVKGAVKVRRLDDGIKVEENPIVEILPPHIRHKVRWASNRVRANYHHHFKGAPDGDGRGPYD